MARNNAPRLVGERSRRAPERRFMPISLPPQRKSFKRERLNAELNRIVLKIWYREVESTIRNTFEPVGVELNPALTHARILLEYSLHPEQEVSSNLEALDKGTLGKLRCWFRKKFSQELRLRAVPSVSIETRSRSLVDSIIKAGSNVTEDANYQSQTE